MDRSRTRPTVLLVHGAGLGAVTFDGVTDRLVALGLRPVAVTRRGYDDRPATADLDRHVDDLAATAAAATGGGRAPVVVVGVSGGATLALALALRNQAGVAAVIAHEPLLGPIAGPQHTVIADSIRDLVDDPDPEAPERFLRRLVTPERWASLPAGVRRRAVANGATIRCEAPGFARFAVTGPQLRRRRTPLVWTVGRSSPDWRRRAACVGVGAGASVRTVAATHTPQVECPDQFTQLIAEVADRAGTSDR